MAKQMAARIMRVDVGMILACFEQPELSLDGKTAVHVKQRRGMQKSWPFSRRTTQFIKQIYEISIHGAG